MSYNVFAFYHGDPDGERDERRHRLDPSRIDLLPEWMRHHGFDSVLVEWSPQDAVTTPTFAHHICADPRCPGGCGYE